MVINSNLAHVGTTLNFLIVGLARMQQCYQVLKWEKVVYAIKKRDADNYTLDNVLKDSIHIIEKGGKKEERKLT